jgi:hypothetical protein
MTLTKRCEQEPHGSADLESRAKTALEEVCSGAHLEGAPRYYSPAFVDHVNGLEYRGLAGVRQSVQLYSGVLTGMTIQVQDQVLQGDRVTSRFVISGSNRGRAVRFTGITISRFEEGLIVEDWSVIDSLGLLRQLGVWRSALTALRLWRRLRSR